MAKRLPSPSASLDAVTLPNDLPDLSAMTHASSMQEVVWEAIGVRISVTREMLACRDVNLSLFIVTLPPDLTEEQRGEIDYWLQEVGGTFRYAAQ